MRDTREKLVELLSLDLNGSDGYEPELIADHLLANGVFLKPKEYDPMDFCGVICKFAEEALKPKWIPVSERLPEEEEAVLIYTKHTQVKACGTYTKRYGFCMSEGFICGDGFMPVRLITHWMPLPEPPEEE